MAALLHQQSRPNYDYEVSDLKAGVRTTFIYVILWGKRLPNTLQDVYYSTDFNELTPFNSNFHNKTLCENGAMWIIRFLPYLSIAFHIY
jgi:hypothetical protein